jgi:serine/threonine protein kinase
LNAKDSHLKEFKREISALVKLGNHANLVTFIGVSITENELWVVTEYCHGGTLFDLLHRKKDVVLTWK